MDQIYSPGAGHLPPAGVLPGREDILATWESMVARVSAEGRPRASDLVLTGNRGIGKTVTMKRCVEVAEAQGYVTLAFQATEDTTLSAALLEGTRQHLEQGQTFWAKAGRALSRISGISLGFASIDLAQDNPLPDGNADPYNATAIGNALSELATQIRDHQDGSGGIVITIDEFQAAAGPDIRTIGAVLNHLNNRHSSAPVVFIASGLPSTMAAMMGPDPEHPRISNPSRLFRLEEPSQYLTREEVELALRAPALAAGGDWHQLAIAKVYEATRGYPAHLQVVAAAAWSHAAGPTVALSDVEASLPAARAEVDRMYNQPRWGAMGEVQKAYVTALALCGGQARSGKIAAMIGRSTTAASGTRDALIRRGDIFAPRDGWVSLAQPLMTDFAPLAYRGTYRENPTLPSLPDMARDRDTYRDARERLPQEPELSDDAVRALMDPPTSPGAIGERRRPPKLDGSPGQPGPSR